MNLDEREYHYRSFHMALQNGRIQAFIMPMDDIGPALVRLAPGGRYIEVRDVDLFLDGPPPPDLLDQLEALVSVYDNLSASLRRHAPDLAEKFDLRADLIETAEAEINKLRRRVDHLKGQVRQLLQLRQNALRRFR